MQLVSYNSKTIKRSVDATFHLEFSLLQEIEGLENKDQS